MKQYPIELHAHTHHSDGDFTVEELVAAALDFGYSGLILTDHNTYSGYDEIVEKQLDKKIVMLKGIEWTTYFGHMLVHGAKSFVDWRTATIDSIDQHIEEVKKVDGLVGVAHPFAIGSPICTGCHWLFNVQDWSSVDYIEIWNRTNPHKQFWSDKAYDLWSEQLKQGNKVSCSAGRDWHRPDAKGMLPGVTYVQTKEDWSPEAMKAALKKGASYITLAPRLECSLTSESQYYSFGDSISMGTYRLSITCMEPDLPSLAALDIEPKHIRIFYNEHMLEEIEIIDPREVIKRVFTLEKGHIRVEIVGRYQHEERIKLVIGNPIYIQ